MKRIIAQTRKELTQMSRDKIVLGMTFLLPLVLQVLLGKAISLSVNDLPIVVKDFDQTPMSRRYAETFRQSITFRVVPSAINEPAEQPLLENRARGVVVVPKGFARDIERGLNAEVQMLVDATDVNTANILRGNAVAAGQAFLAAERRAAGVNAGPPINAEMRLWFNPGRKADVFIAPGVFVLGLTFFMSVLAALGMSRERTQRTILQVYASGISAHEFLIGKILAFTLLGFGQWAVSLPILMFVFGLPLVGDPTVFMAGSLLFLLSVTGFGTMIGAVVKDQAAAIQATNIGAVILALLLSGLIYPVEKIAPALRVVSNISQARYFIEIMRDSFIRGGGWPAVWWAVAMIAVIFSGLYTVAWLRMRPMREEA